MFSRKRFSWAVLSTLTMFFTSLLTMGSVTPAWSAADPPLPTPLVSDVCGASKDQVYVADDTDPATDVGWKDTAGAYYAPGKWNSTNKASSITLTVEVWGPNGLTTYTYPTITFGVEPDANCVQAMDTVTVTDQVCMPNGGTRATFTYVNTPDIGWPQTFVTLYAERWDAAQAASFNITNEGVSVPEGGSVSVTGGDTLHIQTAQQFFLLPGTYSMWVRTVESGQRKLSNTFFVKACGEYKVPAGDPSGQGGSDDPGDGAGSAVPKGKLVQVSPTKMKVKAINKGVLRATKFKVVIDPVRGKTTTKSIAVKAGKKAIRSYVAPARTRFVLKARVLVEDTRGRLVNKWKVLKISTLKSR